MYDTIIVGGGPCGLTAAIYLARANKKVLVLEKFAVGGQMAQTFNIENYPGEMKIDGFVLAENMQKQCKALGLSLEEIKEVTPVQSANVNRSYILPSIELLDQGKKSRKQTDHALVEKNIETLEQVLRDFGILFNQIYLL